MTRVLAWFSAGAASAVATKLAIAKHGDAVEAHRIDPGSEHPDNDRFSSEVEVWIGGKIPVSRSTRYRDTWAVWEGERFIVSPYGAPCTGILKKEVRAKIERPGDVQVFGYTVEEQSRADRFREQNPGVELETPLIDAGLTKEDCLAIVDRQGIELPAMYRLGYRNNNCIGCPKGGMGYWNKIRRDFPDVFARMAALEETLGATVLRDAAGPVPLHALDANRGNHADEPDFECSLMCAMAESEIGATP